MASRLSHSAVSRYQTCPKSYDYHYNQRLRPTTTSAALLFGSALDNAVNSLLTKDGKDPMEVFEKSWSWGKVGNAYAALPMCEDIVYAAADFDRELLINEDIEQLEKDAESLGLDLADVYELYDSIGEDKSQRGWPNLSAAQRKWYNKANWLSLRRKGHLMLTAYNEKIMPLIKRVVASQKRIELKNEEGDSIIGFIDLIAELQDGKIVVFDNKTSSIEYAEDSVRRSAQLALYLHAVQDEFATRHAGYIVIRKGIKKNREKMCGSCGYQAEKGARHKTCTAMVKGKRCGGEWIETISPEVDINLLIDTIPERTEAIVVDNFADIAHLIKQKIYPRNFNSCKQPWGDCPYLQYCWYGKKDGLEVVESDERT